MAANELRERPVMSGMKKVAATGMGSLMPVQTTLVVLTAVHFAPGKSFEQSPLCHVEDC